jgi:DDE superfamily endonuclease
MFTPAAEVTAVLAAFAPLFTQPSWLRAQALLCGTLLAPANHTVTAALRALGLAGEPGFQNYHRLLNRARWSARQAAQVLLTLLVAAFVPSGPVILGLDDTIERRRGRKLTARAIYYDAARSSKACFQKTSGLRWMSVALLVPVRSRRPGLGAALSDGPMPFRTLRPLRACNGAGGTSRWWSEPEGCWAKCAVGCPSGRSLSWPTRVTPRWTWWPGARGRLGP